MTHRPTRLAGLLAVLYAALLAVASLWLDDFGQQGPRWAASLAVQHLQTALLAVASAALLWWLKEPFFWALLRALAAWRAQARWRRWLLACAAAFGVVLLTAALHWAHKLAAVPGLPSAAQAAAAALSRELLATGWFPVRPSTTLEMLRLPACVLMAWALYQWAQAGLSWRAHLGMGAAVVGVVMLGLWVSRDRGPMLVIALALAVAVPVAMTARLPRPWRGIVATVGAVALVGALLLLLPMLTPPERVQAWRQPYAARLEYLAEISWWVQAGGPSGFGLGQAPWCGHIGTAVGELAVRCMGLPTETPSDFTLGALAGLWGPGVAWGLAAAVALWLLGLLTLAAWQGPGQHGVDAASLAASAGALYALMLLAQWAVTVLGNVGLLPLTGVPLPLLSWGRLSLCGATWALALVWPRHAPQAAYAGGLPELWRQAAQVAGGLAAGGALALALGLRSLMQAEVPTTLSLGRSNPWAPLPACVQLAGGGAWPVQGWPLVWQQRLCGSLAPQAPTDPVVRQALQRAAHRAALGQPRAIGPWALPQRRALQVSLNAADQARATQLVQCLTGHAGQRCMQDLPSGLAQDWATRPEGAAARAVAIVSVRLRDGALLAAASSRSPCSQAQMQGLARQARTDLCPPEAQDLRRRADRLQDQSLHAFDMPGSLYKPWMAAALLDSPGGQRLLQGPGREALLSALAHSDTAFFIDQLLCFQSGGDPQHCDGPDRLRQTLQRGALGADVELVSGLHWPGLRMPIAAWPPKGPGAPREWAAARACHAQARDQRWRQCQGERTAAVVAPLWGQGDTRSSLLAVAQAYVQLVAAARGQTQSPALWLLTGAGPTRPTGVSADAASLVMAGLQRATVAGTGRGACVSVLGAQGCAGRGWAMKTGTSLFPHHRLSAAQRAAHCQALGDERSSAVARLHCALYPLKWAVLVEDAAADPEARLSVVLAERNWRADGHLDAGDDRSPNVAAQAAVLLHAQTVR